MKKYVSPMVRVRAIVSGQEKNVSKKERRLAERMARLLLSVIFELELEQAPKFVFRWVANGANVTIQQRRSHLVLHLRRSIERPLNGWFEERHCTAALAVLDAARDAARKRGLIMPGIGEISLDAYRAAIAGAAKKKGARASVPEDEATIEGDDPSSPEGEGVDDGNGNDQSEAEDSGPPTSERFPLGRGRDLQRLSDFAREVLASGDVELADEINALIARFRGKRNVG